ncbi:hypothetical protein BVY01_02920 [bacterium I07]|nr:hypothetical protein BVY01_02920 [bacterium I07]
MDGGKSTGRISEYEWAKSTNGNFVTFGGNSASIQDTLEQSGIREYQLTVKANDGGSDTAFHDVLGIAPDAPYNNPLAFTGGDLALYIMNPHTDSSPTKIRSFVNLGNGISWEPRGKRLALSVMESLNQRSTIYIYDTESRHFAPMESLPGSSRSPAWNPKYPLVAYVNSDRYGGSQEDLVIHNLETGETKYLSDMAGHSGIHPDFKAEWGLSWSPDGEKLYANGSRFGSADAPWRIAVWSGIPSGSPTRTQLHSDAQLSTYFGTDAANIREGMFGLSCSPDGELIAYSLTISGIQKIAIARADGSGIVNLLPYDHVYNPCWSPGGRYLVFDTRAQDDWFNIKMTDRYGENIKNLTESSTNTYQDSAWGG